MLVTEALATTLGHIDTESWQQIFVSSVILVSVVQFLKISKALQPEPNKRSEGNNYDHLGNIYLDRRNDPTEGSVLDMFNLNKVLGLSRLTDSMDDKTKTVLGDTLGVAFNIYEFLSSHKSLVEGAVENLDGVGALQRNDAAAGSGDPQEGEDGMIGGILRKDTVQLMMTIRNTVRYIGSFVKLFNYANANANAVAP